MIEIHFLIKEEIVNTMTWDEYEAFEKAQEGTVKLKDIRPVLARFMVNGDGSTPVPHTEAMKILGKLPIAKIKETVELFTQTINGTLVPKASGSLSKSLTEAEQAGSPSPDGSIS